MIENQERGSIHLIPLLNGEILRIIPPDTLSEGMKRVSDVQGALLKVVGGQENVMTEAGIIDILSKKEVIEIREVERWKEGLGQLMIFSNYFPKHQRRMQILGECHTSSLKIIIQHCDRLNIRVTWNIEP